MRTHLTEVAVRALKPAGKQYKVWDTVTPGFGVLVGKTKSFFVMYGKERTLKVLGKFPGMSLADARRAAMGYLSARPEASKAPKFAEALQNFYDIHCKANLKPRTQREIKRVLDRHFLPPFKHKRLDQIEYGDITKITDDLAKGTPSEAWHAFKDARTFFRWCVPRYIKHSPMEGLKAPTKPKARKRVLKDPEIVRVWLTAEEVGYPFGTAIHLSLLWGTRWSETIGCRRAFINEMERTITYPETKNRMEHHFPYGDMTQAILDAIPRYNWTDLLFPGRDIDAPQPWNGAGKAKTDFNELCEIAHWQLRDLRRTFGTKLAELHVAPHVVERMLNHKLGTLQTEGVITAVADVYNRHRYLSEMRQAVELWEAKLSSLLRPH